MKIIKLKPCPFCGGEAKIRSEVECIGHGDYLKMFYVMCEDCCARTGGVAKPYFTNPEEYATEKWNTRKGV